jgi:hypothetical protein
MRLAMGSTALLALGFAASCAKDPVSGRSASEEESARRGAPEAASLDRGGHSSSRDISVIDDCDPNDPGWAPTGGCVLQGGHVTLAEFNALLTSPPSASLIGHPAWRNQPSALDVADDKSVRVTNDGGRLHTFTHVAAFGGGRVPPLNVSMVPAPECLLAPGATDPNQLPPGEQLTVRGLPPGLHRFQCCIHPWMRAVIRVH